MRLKNLKSERILNNAMDLTYTNNDFDFPFRAHLKKYAQKVHMPCSTAKGKSDDISKLAGRD